MTHQAYQTHQLHSWDIVIAEDNASDLKFLLDILTESGYRVRPASDGELILRSVRARLPDLILLDIKLPGMNGVEICRRLKADPCTRNVPVIFISALEETDMKVKALEAGAIDYITKPIVASEALVRINTHLKMYQLHQRLEEQSEKLAAEIEERKKVEATLRKYEHIVSISNGFIAMVDANYHYKVVNKSYQSTFGEQYQEIVGRSVPETMGDEWFQRNVKERFERCLNGETVKFQTRIDSSNSGCKYLNVTYYPSFDDEGKISEVVMIADDITSLKQAEETLKKTNNELEQKVVKRTEELQHEIDERKQIEESLLIAKQEAEHANQAKTEFLANISHELRNPMHQILSYSKYGLAKIKKVNKEKLFHYFNQISKSANRLMFLLNDLLDISKMESGKMGYKMETANVYQILNDVVSELKPMIEGKNVSLEVIDPLISTKVICDYYKMGQVIRNLLTNAIKFTPEEKYIVVFFKQCERANKKCTIPSLQVSICDQGVGIPEDELDLVFDKFTQSSKTKTGVGGTGLGLAICQEIVEAHGGRIWAENNSESGATFSFVLPCEQQES